MSHLQHLDARTAAGVLFLALQVILAIAANFTSVRYFCWAPHTSQVQFRAIVEINGKALTPAQVQQRYHLHSPAWEAHAAANLIDTIRRYETTLGRGDGARVRLLYQANGGTEQRWNWP